MDLCPLHIMFPSGAKRLVNILLVYLAVVERQDREGRPQQGCVVLFLSPRIYHTVPLSLKVSIYFLHLPFSGCLTGRGIRYCCCTGICWYCNEDFEGEGANE